MDSPVDPPALRLSRHRIVRLAMSCLGPPFQRLLRLALERGERKWQGVRNLMWVITVIKQFGVPRRSATKWLDINCDLQEDSVWKVATQCTSTYIWYSSAVKVVRAYNLMVIWLLWSFE